MYDFTHFMVAVVKHILAQGRFLMRQNEAGRISLCSISWPRVFNMKHNTATSFSTQLEDRFDHTLRLSVSDMLQNGHDMLHNVYLGLMDMQ